MKLREAIELLGLSEWELEPDRIREAFRHEVMKHHPDTQGQAMGEETGRTIDQLKAARDTLLNRRNVDEFACRTCKGTGSVRYRMGTRPCGACKGTGDGNGS